jgi:hypothetical protein
MVYHARTQIDEYIFTILSDGRDGQDDPLNCAANAGKSWKNS